jgi:hypothetical protein
MCIIHTNLLTCMYSKCVHVNIHAHIHVCVCVCERERERERVCVCVCVSDLPGSAPRSEASHWRAALMLTELEISESKREKAGPVVAKDTDGSGIFGVCNRCLVRVTAMWAERLERAVAGGIGLVDIRRGCPG